MAQIIIDEGAAAATPASGKATTYVKTDGLWYSKDDAGNEYIMSGAQTTGYPTVTSAASPDIFGAAGATISINNSTPVTTTDFTDCTTAQVGSVKRVIPVQAWTVTASSNMTVNGFTSGDFVLQADSMFTVLAKSTSTFAIEGVIKDTITLTVKGSISDPTTPVTTSARRTVYPNKIIGINFQIDNVSLVGGSGNLYLSGLSHASSGISNGPCGLIGLGTNAAFIETSNGTTNLMFIEIMNMGTNVTITAATGKYMRGDITYYAS